MVVSDPNGDLWEVRQGDPASKACEYLRRQGFPEDKIVLPIDTLLEGRTDVPVPSINMANEHTNEEVVRWFQLKDCLLSLTKSGIMEGTGELLGEEEEG